MPLEIILPFFSDWIKDPIQKYVFSPLKRRICYAFSCDSNVDKLQEQANQLTNKRDTLQQSVVAAERSGEQIFEHVTNWLSRADTEIKQARGVISGKGQAKMEKYFFGLCPNLKTRYQLSRTADKKALAIGKLRNEEGFDSISFLPPLQQIVEPSVYAREALPSRVLMLNQVMDALKDPNLYMIGVYGMGGVGKTTLAKEVHRKAIEENSFGSVVIVPVSQTPDFRRIQAEIAEFLGLKFDVDETTTRASRLFGKLKNSNALIILDDIWAKLDLNSVGIPLGQGCKLLLTSWSKKVLSTEMGTQEDFSIEVLPEKEARELFEMSAANANDPELRATATEVVKKCAGLPLLLLKVAADLRNKESYAWNDMLNKLSVFDNEEVYGKIHEVLQSSYHNLPAKELQSFFLLCALYGRSNVPIRDLVIYSMGLGLFKNIYDIEGARNRVLSHVSKLKDESLLLDGDMKGCVKMHDVVRDTALRIACDAENAFIGDSG